MTDKTQRELAGRTILMIGIGFYDYEQAIADELRRQGATVRVYDELPAFVRRGLSASLLRRFKVDARGMIHAHQRKILEEFSGLKLDQVLIIKGEHIGRWFLNALRTAHPGVRLISYHWDSLMRYPDLIALQDHFDSVYTFDHADAERFPSFSFRPLFFRSEISRAARSSGQNEFDLSFVGWLHHGRLQQLINIHQSIHGVGLRCYFYLYTGWFSRMRLTVMGRANFVKSRTMGFEDYVALLHDTRAIVDLPHPDQTGLTMRAIEVLGAGKKLITTSRHIEMYNFYRPENIQIIQPDKPVVDAAFVRQPGVELPASVVEMYSLRAWVREIFDLGAEAGRGTVAASRFLVHKGGEAPGNEPD